MPPPETAVLIDGAAVLDVALTRKQAGQLTSYLALLTKWNRVYNLTAVRKADAMVVHHLLDCLALVAPLRDWTAGKALRVLDVGSGAGLPGVVIALSMPELDVTCVDAVGKKAAFIRQVVGDLALKNVHVLHSRVEGLPDSAFDVITSRAFASGGVCVELTWRLRGKESVWLAMKAGLPDDEIAALPKGIDLFHVEQRKVPGLDAERCLIWMRERRDPLPDGAGLAATP